MMFTDFELYGVGTKYPTIDGGELKLGPGPIFGKLRLRFEHKEEEHEIGSCDVIAAEFHFPDSEGNLWLLTIRFGAGFFLQHTLDLTLWDSGLFFLDDCKPEIKKSLNENILLRNIFCGDDIKRGYKVCISNQLIYLNFKLCQATFDVAAHTSKLLVVKINENSILSEHDYIGNFAYLLPIATILRNNTAVIHKPIEYAQEEWLDPYWMGSAIPLPLYFEPTGKKSKPQETVKLVDREE